MVGIVLVEWGDDHQPQLADVAPAQGLVELSQHTVIPDEQLAIAFGRLDSIVRRVPIARMQYGTTADGLALLAEAMRRWLS